jgi:protease-4
MKICIVEINNINFFALEQNTYSLLNSPWMITDTGASALMPNLLSIVRGLKIEPVISKFPSVFSSIDDNSEYDDIKDVPGNSQYISVLSIKSPLFKYDQMCGPVGTRTMTRVLKEWESNDSIIGVVLDIDCPGGQVSGLAEFAEFINNYSKPIVSFTDGTQASAGEYLASACNYKVAHKFAEYLGSIGSMLKYVDFDGILRKEGAVIEDIYATGSPRKNEESRQKQKENSNELIIQNILNPAREQFVSDMKKFRPNIDETLFEGQILRPEEALQKGLIDEIGTIKNAFDKVIELSKTTKKSNSKPNNTMNTKQLPSLQSALGLDAPLASTEEKGTYLNTDQLETVENRLVELETSNSTLQTNLDAALANTEVKDQLTASQGSLTAIEASIDGMLTSAGLDVTGTLTEKTAALTAKVDEMGKADGASHTNPKVDLKNTQNASNVIDGIDISAAMNC